MDIDQPAFTILTPLPGTELYEERRHELVTHDYLLYDVTHTVLPTRLPLERFYERFARLYSMTAKHQRLGWSAFKSMVKLTVGGYGFVYWRLIKALRDLRDPKAYLDTPVESRPPGAEPLAPRFERALREEAESGSVDQNLVGLGFSLSQAGATVDSVVQSEARS
jgi:hypothetical protein